MADSQKHEKISQLERLELGGEKGNCGRVFQFIFRLDKRLKMYGKDKEEKKWYFFENVGVAWARRLKERGGSYRELQEKLKEVVIGEEWCEMGKLELWAIKQGPTETIWKFWERLLPYFDQLETQEAFKKKVFVVGAYLPI
jgi:hypothetical protein